jgi:FkbM family methyltransferase
MHEKEYLLAIKSSLSSYIKNKIVLDIGANIGTHSLFFSSLASKVYSFEPNKKVFDLLYLNTKNQKNIQVFNFGLSNESGLFNALIPMDNTGGAALKKGDLKNSFSVKFRVKKYTDVGQLKNKKIGLIKIDIEGHELNAFQGMKRLLSLQSPLILMEQKDGINNNSSKETDFLNQSGYIHKYEFKRTDDWLYKKLPDSLPKFIKVLFRFTEMLFLGVPLEDLRLVKISKLTKSRYDLLLFSKQPNQQS